MERLKKVIEQYGRWADLSMYAERIEAHITSDFSHAIENAKSLLETIAKYRMKKILHKQAVFSIFKDLCFTDANCFLLS